MFMSPMMTIWPETSLRQPERSLSQLSANVGRLGGVRILVVEDEVASPRRSPRPEAEGFDVDAVHDGLDGLWRAREAYDAIVLDIMLPGMNGYKVCRTLREEEVWTPILMLTAKDGEYDEAEALDTGADDFLAKPFSFVGAAGPAPGLDPSWQRADLRPLELGDLVLDRRPCACRRRDGSRRRLTRASSPCSSTSCATTATSSPKTEICSTACGA